MDDEKKPKQVANLKKDSPTKAFVKRFFNTDFKQMRNDAIDNVIMPGIYHLGSYLWDSIWLDGRSESPIEKSSISKNNKTNYSSKFHYKSTGTSPKESVDYTEVSKPKYTEIIVESRDDAINVLDSMSALVAETGVADRNQLYSLIGVSGDFQDSKWGWTSDTWKSPKFRRVRDGYLLMFDPISHLTD